jgi:hypothetical protein
MLRVSCITFGGVSPFSKGEKAVAYFDVKTDDIVTMFGLSGVDDGMSFL